MAVTMSFSSRDVPWLWEALNFIEPEITVCACKRYYHFGIAFEVESLAAECYKRQSSSRVAKNLYLFASACSQSHKQCKSVIWSWMCDMFWPFTFYYLAISFPFVGCFYEPMTHSAWKATKWKEKCESIENNLRRYLQHLLDYFCVFYLFLWSVQRVWQLSFRKLSFALGTNSNIYSIFGGIWDETFFAYYSDCYMMCIAFCLVHKSTKHLYMIFES